MSNCVEIRLAPCLAPGTVVILGNLSTHRSPRAAALKAGRCWFLFLPPYSPDLNPIEMAFSKLKAHLQRLEARSFERVLEAMGSICDLFTPTECENDFRAAGYPPLLVPTAAPSWNIAMLSGGHPHHHLGIIMEAWAYA